MISFNKKFLFIIILITQCILTLSCSTINRAINPEKGLYQALVRSRAEWEKEIQRAQNWHEEVLQHFTPTENLAMQEKAQDIAEKIVKLNQISVIIPKVTVLKGNEYNAFTIGGGYIYIFEGLMNAVKNESELAMVIAHELAHCTAGHVGSFSWYIIKEHLISESTFQFPEIKILEEEYEYKGKHYLKISLDAPDPETAITLILKYLTSAYSRREEREADILAAYYITNAGYELNKALELFRRVSRKEVELRKKAIKELEPLFIHLKDAYNDYVTIRKKVIENPFRYELYKEQEVYLKRWLEAKDKYKACLYKWKDILFQIPVWFRTHPPINERIAYLKETLQALKRKSLEGVSTLEVKYTLSNCWLIEKGLPFPESK